MTVSEHIPETTNRTGLKRSGLLLFFGALMVSAAGDEIAVIAMVFRMAEQGHGGLVAALLIAQMAPMVLLAPVVGHLIDRHDVSRLLIVASILQGLILLAVVTVDNLAVLIAGMLLISAIGSLAMPAVLTLLPIIAGQAVPTRSNSTVEGGRAFACAKTHSAASSLIRSIVSCGASPVRTSAPSVASSPLRSPVASLASSAIRVSVIRRNLPFQLIPSQIAVHTACGIPGNPMACGHTRQHRQRAPCLQISDPTPQIRPPVAGNVAMP